MSVITTKRAYEELEKAGYVYTIPAKGSYVAEKNTQLIRETYLTQIEEHLNQIFSPWPPAAAWERKNWWTCSACSITTNTDRRELRYERHRMP